MNTTLNGIIAVVACTLLIGGCAPVISETNLIPTSGVHYRSVGKTIEVLPVKVRPQPPPGFLEDTPVMPSGEAYRSAIASSLERSGLFDGVILGGEADLTLSTEVIGQRIQGGVSNVGLLLIRYELRDTQTREPLWEKNLLSYKQMSAQDVFAGITRVQVLIETITRDNMTQLQRELGAARAWLRR